MNILNNKRIYILYYCLIFEVFSLISLFFIKYLSIKIFQNTSLDAYYWLSPIFSIIQTGNYIVVWGGMFTAIVSCIFPTKINKFKLSYILLFAKINIISILMAIFTTFIFEELNFPHKGFSVDILFHSFSMLTGIIIFLFFWSCFGFGLRLLLKNRLIAACICFIEPNFEHYFLFFNMPQYEKFFPFALSRELIVRNYPFWDSNSWASISNTVAYANGSYILNEKLKPLNISFLWIITFLFGYLMLIYIKPIIQTMMKYKKQEELFYVDSNSNKEFTETNIYK